MTDYRALYFDLLKRSLLGLLDEDPPCDPWSGGTFDLERRRGGLDWPSRALTMIGERRIDNLHWAIVTVLRNGVPGDFVETGVWRGGACIYARALLDATAAKHRIVWCCDSFEGLPVPGPDAHPADVGDLHHTHAALAVSQEAVEGAFARYGLLSDRVRFLKGWFKDTLPGPIERIAVLRLDGDMYGSTMDVLTALYDRVSDGGVVIVDDYHAVAGCREAVQTFLYARNIAPPLTEIDGVGVFWIKEPPDIPMRLRDPTGPSFRW